MKTLNKITLAGLVFLGANAIETKAQYSQKGWTIVTENEFNRLKIPEDSIQNVNLIKNKDSSRYTDNSKRGKKFTDINGEKYFWVNPNPTGEIYSFDRGREILVQPQTKKENSLDNPKVEEKLTEAQQLEAIINDPEIKNLIKDFNSSFQVRWTYAVLGEDIFDNGINMLRKKGNEVFMTIAGIEDKYPKGTILKDKKTSKEVLVIQRTRWSLSPDLESFLNTISYGTNVKHAVKMLVYKNPKTLTLEEKKDFIRPYFTDSIPNAIKNLPKYIPPIIYKNEFKQEPIAGKPVKYQNNIKFNDTKPAKSVEMNEQKLDEILKEE